MSTLKKLQEAAIALQGNEVRLAVESINESKQLFLDLNASQLAQGYKKNDKISEFQYSPVTIEIKKTKNGLSGVTSHLTNYDTGESYRMLYMEANENTLKAGTSSGLEDEISGRMNGQAFGLNSENREIFIKDSVQGIFVGKIKKALNL